MTHLPNGQNAIVDLAKLREYCLNPNHLRGRHKARVFRASLGIGPEDAELLRSWLLDAARDEPTVQAGADEFGRRFVVDFGVETADVRTMIRSCWIIRTGEVNPRLTTCYVL